VQRADSASRNNDRPNGVTDSFQVSTHSVEPILANRCRNLFSHDNIGPTGIDKSKELGPEVALVVLPLLLAGGAEGLAGTGSGPQGAVVRPSSKSGCEGPASDPGEEMTLIEVFEIVRSNIDN
jgi:hypothetical protein